VCRLPAAGLITSAGRLCDIRHLSVCRFVFLLAELHKKIAGRFGRNFKGLLDLAPLRSD